MICGDHCFSGQFCHKGNGGPTGKIYTNNNSKLVFIKSVFIDLMSDHVKFPSVEYSI